MLDNLDAHACSFEHLCESAKSLKEAFQQGSVMGVRLAPFNVTKHIEDFRVTLDRVSMSAQWDVTQKYVWECGGMANHEDLLKRADKGLEKSQRARSSCDVTEAT